MIIIISSGRRGLVAVTNSEELLFFSSSAAVPASTSIGGATIDPKWIQQPTGLSDLLNASRVAAEALQTKRLKASAVAPGKAGSGVGVGGTAAQDKNFLSSLFGDDSTAQPSINSIFNSFIGYLCGSSANTRSTSSSSKNSTLSSSIGISSPVAGLSLSTSKGKTPGKRKSISLLPLTPTGNSNHPDDDNYNPPSKVPRSFFGLDNDDDDDISLQDGDADEDVGELDQLMELGDTDSDGENTKTNTAINVSLAFDGTRGAAFYDGMSIFCQAMSTGETGVGILGVPITTRNTDVGTIIDEVGSSSIAKKGKKKASPAVKSTIKDTLAATPIDTITASQQSQESTGTILDIPTPRRSSRQRSGSNLSYTSQSDQESITSEISNISATRRSARKRSDSTSSQNSQTSPSGTSRKVNSASKVGKTGISRGGAMSTIVESESEAERDDYNDRKKKNTTSSSTAPSVRARRATRSLSQSSQDSLQSVSSSRNAKPNRSARGKFSQ